MASPRATRTTSRTPKSSSAKQSKPSSRKPRTGSASKTATTATPPAASVAAAQKVLRSLERREAGLRKSLERQTKTLKTVKKALTEHRHAVKGLAADLKKVKKTRKAVTAEL